MTINALFELLEELSKIDTPKALGLLEVEATTHNIQMISDYINSYYRNR